MTDRPQRHYLGDGVYASFDGYHVWLETQRREGLHRIALEPEVLDALALYRERIRQQQQPQESPCSPPSS